MVLEKTSLWLLSIGWRNRDGRCWHGHWCGWKERSPCRVQGWFVRVLQGCRGISLVKETHGACISHSCSFRLLEFKLFGLHVVVFLSSTFYLIAKLQFEHALYISMTILLLIWMSIREFGAYAS